MEDTIIKPRVLKPDQKKARKKRLIKIGLVVAVAIVIVAALYFFVFGNTKSTRSRRLAGTVTHLKNTHSTCQDGLKKLQLDAQKLENSTDYTNAAREQGLNYLMQCDFLTGNNQEGLKYATLLNQLYVADNNLQKQAQLAQLVKYIQNYGGK